MFFSCNVAFSSLPPFLPTIIKEQDSFSLALHILSLTCVQNELFSYGVPTSQCATLHIFFHHRLTHHLPLRSIRCSRFLYHLPRPSWVLWLYDYCSCWLFAGSIHLSLPRRLLCVCRLLFFRCSHNNSKLTLQLTSPKARAMKSRKDNFTECLAFGCDVV